MNKKKILALLLAILLIIPVFPMNINYAEGETGTKYYFSTKNGDDKNNGTSEASAFYSLRKIKELKLKAGDEILLEKGSIFENEFIHLKDVHGTAEKPIKISSYGEGNLPIINTNSNGLWWQDYSEPMDNTQHRSSGYVSSSILLYDVDHVIVENLEITNKSNDFDYIAESDKMSARMDRTGVAGIAKNHGAMENITISNLNIHDVDGNIQDKHMNNGGIQINALKPDNEAQTGVARFKNITIQNNYVKDVSRAGIVLGYTYKHSKFRGSQLADELFTANGHENINIKNNYVQNAGNDSIVVMYALRPLVQNNVSDKGGADMLKYKSYWQNFSAGIWPWKTKDAIFERNEVFDTNGQNNGDGQAWDIDWSDGTIYQYNYSHNNGGGALLVCLNEAYNGTFRYNISQNDLGQLLTLQGNPNAKIYNNIFYIDGDLSTRVHHSAPQKQKGAAEIKNNIFYNKSTNNPNDAWEPTLGGAKFSHNIYFGYNSTPKSDKNAITKDPLFVNPGKAPTKPLENRNVNEKTAFDGYKLQDNSPAINAGIAVENNLKDFFGNKVPSVPSIGIYENGSTVLSNDNVLKATTFDFRDNKIYVPAVENKGTTVKDLLDSIQISETATAKVLKGGKELSAETVLSEGTILQIQAENKTTRDYLIAIKNTYNWALDYQGPTQGNLWFAQLKDNDAYTNISKYSNEWPNWETDNYGTVGVDLPNQTTAPDENTHGLLADMMNTDQNKLTAMAYRVPKSGQITFKVKDNEPYLRQEPNTGGTVKLIFTHNGKEVQSIVLKDSKVKVDVKAMNIKVEKGDMIRVEAQNIGNPTKPSVHITPIIEYTDFETKAKVDISKLEELLAQANAIEKDKLVDASLTKLNELITQLETAIANEDITVDEVNTLVNTSTETLKGLEYKKPVNKMTLITLINKVESLDLSNKTDESKNALLNLVKEAKELLNKEGLTQGEVDAKIAEITKAIVNLKDKEKEPEQPKKDDSGRHILEVALEIAKNIDSERFTASSRNKLQDSISKIEKELEKENIEKATADKLVNELSIAIQNLEIEAETEPGHETETETKVLVHGYAKSNIKVFTNADDSSKVLGNIKAGLFIEGVKKDNYIEIPFKDKIGYIKLSDIQDMPIIIKGYSRVNQNFRSEKGDILSVIERNEKLVGILKGDRVELDYNGKHGLIHKTNIVDKPIIASGYAKFTQNIRDINGNIVGILPKGTYVKGIMKGNKVPVSYNGHFGYVYGVNLQKDNSFEGVINKDVYVRNQKGKILGILKKGTRIQCLVYGKKAHFNYNGQAGTIYLQYMN